MLDVRFKTVCLLALFGCVLARRDDANAGFDVVFERPNVIRETSASSTYSFVGTLLPTTTDFVHSPSLAPTSDGRFFVVWYGGSREGARDVEIFGTVVDRNGAATEPRALLDRRTLTRQTGRSIRKLGNPVVYSQNGRLWLFVVSVSYGGWSGSSLNAAYSDDDGATWSTFRRLRTTPIFNISSLVRTPCVARANGGFLLPAYCEFATKYGLSLLFNAAGKLVDRSKIPIEKNAASLQPSIVPFDSKNALAFSRVPSGGIGVSKSTDGGTTWTKEPRLSLENRDSSVAAFRLKNGATFLVGNPAKENRTKLVLWKTSNDECSTWETVAELENELGSEFSYPSVFVDGDRAYLTYTWKRRAIKWIDLTPYLDEVFESSELRE